MHDIRVRAARDSGKPGGPCPRHSRFRQIRSALPVARDNVFVETSKCESPRTN